MSSRDFSTGAGNNLNFTVPRDIYSPPLTPVANTAISKSTKLYTTTLAPSPELLSNNVNSPILLPKKVASGKSNNIPASMTQDPNEMHHATSSHAMPMICNTVGVGITDPLFHSSDYFSLFCPNNSVLSQNQLINPNQSLFMPQNLVPNAQGNPTIAHGLDMAANRAYSKDAMFSFDPNLLSMTGSIHPVNVRGPLLNNSSVIPESPDLPMLRAPLFPGSFADISNYRTEYRPLDIGTDNAMLGSSVLLDANKFAAHQNVELHGEAFQRDMDIAAFQMPFDPTFMNNVSTNFENNMALANGSSINGAVLPHLNSQDISNLGTCKYQCNHPGCGRSFEKLTQLRSHTKTHSMEKPFVCETCEMRFSRNHDLKRHQRIHSGIRPYTCDNCAKSFIRLDALSRHLKVNNGRGCKSRLKKD